MKKFFSEENTLIGIQAIREVIEIFSGPFLTAYFIKTSIDTLSQISIYNIYVYLILAISSVLVCYLIKRKYKIQIFRISVVINFFYILIIIILKENVINHLGILSVFYGISTASYWVPLGLFLINKVKNERRMSYETKNQMVKTLVKILVPILLGSMITVSNYYFTAIIILILSIIQIIFSFILKPLEDTTQKFNIRNAWKKIKGIKNIKTTLFIEYLCGLCISNSSLTILTTILVFNTLQTDFKLGIITSITSALQMLNIYLYNKRISFNSKAKPTILLTSIVPILSLIILLIYKTNITIILFYMLFTIASGLIVVIRTVQIYNQANHALISVDEQCEFWAMRETCINFRKSYKFHSIISNRSSMRITRIKYINDNINIYNCFSWS